jgi:glucokinase
MAQEVYIGVDLGGTRIRAARFTDDLNMQQRTETLTLNSEGPDAVINRMIEQVKIVWPTDGARVAGVGISAPGPINPRTGVIVSPPNLKGWHNIPLRKIFQDRLGVETHLGNDANLAALAEAKMGAARGYQDIVFLTISTGIGSGVISDGILLIGTKGLGAECGHLMIVVDGDRASSLEKEAAGPAITRQARAAIESGEKSAILDLAQGDISAIKAPMVSEAARAGDAVAARIIERVGRIIGLGVLSLLHVFNPQIVVIGGGVAEGTWDLLIDPMWAQIRQYALDPTYWEELIITQATLGENVSLIGAAALAMAKGA